MEKKQQIYGVLPYQEMKRLIENERKYLFSWEENIENDNARLIEFLIQNFNVNWARDAEINKSDDGKTIHFSYRENSLSLSLNNEKTKVNMTINEVSTAEFVANMENGNLNIYDANLIEQYDEKSIKESSYEIRVGSYFDFEKGKQEQLSEGEAIVLEGNCYALLGSIEYFNIPKDITALMWLRTTYARHGWTPWFQGLVDPGFRGRVTIVLHNITSHERMIGVDRICHIRFNRMVEATEKPYTGKYMQSPGAQPPIEDDKKKPTIVKAFIGEPIGKYKEIEKYIKLLKKSYE